MHVKSNMAGVRPEVTTGSLEKNTESETVGERTISERILASNTVLEQFQSGLSKKPSGQGEQQSRDSGNVKQNVAKLLRENTFSGHLNGVADGLGEVSLETVIGVVELGVSAVKTGYDLLLGPTTSELEFAAEEITGQDVQFPEWAPNSDRGGARLKTGADVVTEMVSSPGLMIDAIVDPIKEDWVQGRFGKAIGRGFGEAVSITAGAQGAVKLAKELDAPGTVRSTAKKHHTPDTDSSPNIMEWSPEKPSPWSEIPGATLLDEINKIRIKDKDGAEFNCINCAIANELSMSGHPASAVINGKGAHDEVVEKFFNTRFSRDVQYKEMIAKMLKAGDGARGIVSANHPIDEYRHTYNVHNDGGTIKSTDAQIGLFDGNYREAFKTFKLLINHGVGARENISLAGESIKVLQTVSPGVQLSNEPPLFGAPSDSRLVLVAPGHPGKPDSDKSILNGSDVIASINDSRDPEWKPLTREEEARAVKFYEVSIANGERSDEAMDTAFFLMTPKNNGLEDVDNNWAEVISGELPLLTVISGGDTQRNEFEAAVVRLNIRSLELGRGLLTEEQIDKVREYKLFGTATTKPDGDAANTDAPDGVVDTVLDWLFGKAEAGELESSNGTGTAGVSGESTEANPNELDASFERVNIELTSIALNNGWELPSPPPLDQPDGWGTDADIIGAINDMRTSADHGFDLPPLTEAEEDQAISIYKAAVANDDETRALSLATALTLPENLSVRDRFSENMNAVESGVPLNLILGVDPLGEVRSVGDQRIVAENFARLNRNEPRLTADEEDAIRESAGQAGAAGEGPETPEIAPEVVGPVPTAPNNQPEVLVEESVDPVIENALVDLGIESDFVVASYDQGIAAINAVREADGHAPLTAEEGAIALRIYNASIATEDSSAGALATAAIALDPDNKAMLDKIVEQHEAIEAGELTLDIVLGLEKMSEVRAAGEVAVTGANIARLNNGQTMLDDQASNEMRMLHTGVTSAEEAIIEFNELGGLETDLTAEQEADFMLIFEQVISEGSTPAEAALMARHLLDPENAVTLQLLKGDLAGVRAMLSEGKTLAEVVSQKEVGQIESMSTFSSDVDALIKFHQAAGNAEGVLMLTMIRGIVDTAKAHATEENPVLADGAAIMELSKATGKSFKQLMKMIGEGDAVAYAAVMDDFGRGYLANANEDQIKTSAYSLRGFGDLTYAIGQGQDSKEAMAAGVMLSGAADFYVGLLHEDSNGVTATGGGLSLAGSAVAAFGILSDDPEMTQVGKQWATAASMLGGDSVTTLINSGDYSGAGVKGVQLGFSVAGAIIGGNEGETYGQVGAVLGTGYDLFKAGEAAMNGGGGAGAVVALGMTAAVQVSQMFDVELPEEFLEMGGTLASALTFEAGQEVAVAVIAESTDMLVSAAASVGYEMTYVEALNVVEGIAEIGGYVYAAYKLVTLGFEIAEIADNDELDDTTKATQSMNAVSSFLGSLAVSAAMAGTASAAAANIWNPVGWALAIAAVGINTASAITDMADNGVDQYNVGQLLLGDLSKILFWAHGMEEPEVNMNFWTSSAQTQSTDPKDIAALNNGATDADGLVMHTGADGDGGKDAYLQVESPFGIIGFSIHELEDKGRGERFEVVDDFKPMFLYMRSIDEGLAAGLNAADALNGQAGLSMSSYGSGLAGNRIHQATDAADMDFAQMVDSRYTSLSDRLADSGTVAGQALNAWMDGVGKKTIDESGEAYTIAAAIAKSPVLLTLAPRVIERMLNTVEPGSIKHVIEQLTQTVGTYVSARDNPLVQTGRPMDENQLMDFTIAHLGLTEDYRFSTAPKVDAPERGEVLTAMAGIPQEVQDLALQLNEGGMRDMPGGVALLGRADWNDKFYQLVVNGELDTYRYRGGDEPHFEKVSRVIADLSGDYNNWPPGHAEGLGVDWVQLEAEGARTGNGQWVRDLEDPEVLRAMSAEETDLLRRALVLGSDMQKLGKDVKVLGLSAFGEPGLVEVLIEGKQHAYKLKGDQFMQVSQRNLYLQPVETQVAA